MTAAGQAKDHPLFARNWGGGSRPGETVVMGVDAGGVRFLHEIGAEDPDLGIKILL